MISAQVEAKLGFGGDFSSNSPLLDTWWVGGDDFGGGGGRVHALAFLAIVNDVSLVGGADVGDGGGGLVALP